MEYIILIAGMSLLLYSASETINGCQGLSQLMDINKMIVYVIILGFGSSLPELVVSIEAALINKSDLVIGNIVGSNIINILAALGIFAIFTKITTDISKLDLVFFALSSLVLILLVVFSVNIDYKIGLALLVFMVIYTYMSHKITSADGTKGALLKLLFFIGIGVFVGFKISTLVNYYQNFVGLLLLIGSFGLLLVFKKLPGSLVYTYAKTVVALTIIFVSSRYTVYPATFIASEFGLSEKLISIFILALGTSLPEIFISFAGAIKKQTDTIVANVVGSSIFNVFAIIGITALLHPVSAHFATFKIDMIVYSIICLFVGFLIYNHIQAGKKSGFALSALLILYFTVLIYQG